MRTSPHWLGYAWAAAFALVCLAAQLRVHDNPVIGADDANIFLTYGKNLSSGEGWVYTPGDERVEGTTSFLYTLLTAGASFATRPEPLLGVLNLTLFVAALAGTLRLLVRLRGPEGTPEIGAAVLLTSWWALHPGLSFWCEISLLDTALWTALLVWTISVVVDVGSVTFPRRFAVACAALALTRPEAMAIVPAFGLVALTLARRRGQPWMGVARAVGFGLATFALTTAGLTGFRLLYFGYPLPNTFYAKVGTDLSYNLREGFRYVRDYLSITPLSALLLSLLVILMARRLPSSSEAESRRRSDSGAVSAAVLVLWLVPIFAGGDHFGQGRFLVAATLLLPVPVVASLRFGTRGPMSPLLRALTLVGALAAAGAVHYGLALAFERGSHDTGRELVAAERGRRMARAIGRGFGPEAPSLGGFAVGGLGYEYRGRVIDLLGLNNVAMAHASSQRYGPKNHAAFDAATFYRLRPELVPVALVPRGTAVDLRFLREVTRGLIETPRFYNEYPLVMLERADAETWLREPDFFVPRPLRGVWARSEGGPAAYRVLVTFARRDFLERICAGNFRVRVLGSDCAVVPRERDS